MGLGVELIVPEELLSDDLQNALMNSLRFRSPEIALDIILRIRERTPRDRGALRESETQQAYTSRVSGSKNINLAKWYVEDGPQLAEWGRVYAPYQEGDLPTYTNPPRRMFARTEEDDLGIIETWADEAVKGAADAIGSGPTETFSYGSSAE